MNFCRTVRSSTEIRGQHLERGDYVAMIFTSANRDEEKWEQPHRFDVARTPRPMHLTFGYAQHNCLGQHLARLELRVVLEEILRRFADFGIVGDVVMEP
jgi:cytochrome P450